MTDMDKEAAEGGPANSDEVAQDGPRLVALLQRLDREGRPVEAAYERIRRRLIAYMRLHLPAHAESLADTVLDRLGKRLQDGIEIQDVAHYALGIARLLVLETRARLERERLAAEESERQLGLGASERETELAHAALADCLEELGPASAALLLEYYSADGGARIERRQVLAARLGISLNALRNRALRMRGLLETCTAGRLASIAADERDEPSDNAT